MHKYSDVNAKNSEAYEVKSKLSTFKKINHIIYRVAL